MAQMQPTGSEIQDLIRGQAQCTYNPLFCQGIDPTGQTPCWLPINSISIQFSPNQPTADCTQLAGPGFYMLQNSLQFSPGNTPPNPPRCCHYQFDPSMPYSITGEGGANISYTHSLFSPNNQLGVTYAVAVTGYWQSLSNNWWDCPTDCGTWSTWSPANITSVTCTNDTSQVVFTGHLTK
jgi:hypothetical protein